MYGRPLPQRCSPLIRPPSPARVPAPPDHAGHQHRSEHDITLARLLSVSPRRQPLVDSSGAVAAALSADSQLTLAAHPSRKSAVVVCQVAVFATCMSFSCGWWARVRQTPAAAPADTSSLSPPVDLARCCQQLLSDQRRRR